MQNILTTDPCDRLLGQNDTVRPYYRIASYLEKDKSFVPNVRDHPVAIDFGVGAGDTMRYALEVVSDNFVSPQQHKFEVAWDGQWSFEPEKMEQHLRITEINEP